MNKKICHAIYLIILLFVIFSQSVEASEEFLIESTITYQASLDSTLKVIQEVSLTNKLSNFYAREYSFVIEGEPPININAWDQVGEIKYRLKSDPQLSTISLPFNQEVVGKDKTLKFGLSYLKNDLIKKSGEVWEVTVPRFASEKEVDLLTVVLEVPLSFGKVAFISPSPLEQTQAQGKHIFRFTHDQIVHSGVVAAFGEFQSFDFQLTYHLENPEVSKIRTEIALPPDTSYQKVYYQKITPKPENVEVGQNGNWLAQYKLEPKQKLMIKVQGQAKVFAKPYRKFPSPENLSLFLQPSPHWPIEDLVLSQVAKNLKTPRQVYDFVVDKLTYDYSRVREGAERLGAKEAFNQPDRATCMEFTDLFVALARAAKIPAREINGYAYTTNPQLRPLGLAQDVLHAWPEYWDESSQTWIQIDPTWQSTTGGVDYFNKLDLGHFAFAIHGVESDYPPPAGAYKTQGEFSKDVQVDFGKFQEAEESQIEISFNLPKKIASETKTTGSFTVHNLSPAAVYDLALGVKTKGVQVVLVDTDKIGILPPFAHRSVPLELKSLGLFKTGPAEITITANNQEFKNPLTIECLLLKAAAVLIAFLGLSLTVTYLMIRIRKRKIDSLEDEMIRFNK